MTTKAAASIGEEARTQVARRIALSLSARTRNDKSRRERDERECERLLCFYF